MDIMNCFQFLAIMSKEAMKLLWTSLCEQITFNLSEFLGVEILGHDR